MKVALTEKFCASAKPGEWFDEKATGLALWVGLKRKTWQLHYSRDGKRHRQGLGPYPALTLAAARGKALETKSDIENGRGPVQSGTLKAVAGEWKARNADLRSLGKRWRGFERLVFPTLGVKPIRDIRRSEIVKLLDHIEDTSGPEMADAILRGLSALFSWHATRDDDFVSPIIRGMGRSRGNGRSRILSDAEITAVWNASQRIESAPYGRLIRFLLLTGVRLNEAAKAEWTEIEAAPSLWTVPAARMKQKLDHCVPLSAAAVACLTPNSHRFIFTHSGQRGLTAFAVLKAGLDVASGTSGWVIHDLRRTARSLLGRCGVEPQIAERCLAHVPGGVQGRYDRYAYLPEKREALERLATLIKGIVDA